MNIQNRSIKSIQQIQSEQQHSARVQKSNNTVSENFSAILNQKVAERQQSIKFSKHANQRMDARNIKLSDEQMQKLQSGITQAEAKGIKESLVLMDQIALVVNIENKTVVTALDRNEAREHVFTNIDGAVII